MRIGLFARLLFALAACAACCAIGRGEDNKPVADASPTVVGVPPIIDGHGWIIDRETRQRRPIGSATNEPVTAFLHLPPRIDGDMRGVIRRASGIEGHAGSAAWWRNRLWVLMGEEVRSPDGMRIRVVASATASRGLAGYTYAPDRPEISAPLIGDLDILGWAATAEGPAALVRPRTRVCGNVQHGAFELRVLFDSNWRTVAISPHLADELAHFKPDLVSGAMHMLCMREGLGVLLRGGIGSGARLWSGAMGSARRGDFGPPDIMEWQVREFSLPPNARIDGGAFVQGASPADDALLVWQREEKNCSIYSLRDSDARLIAILHDVPQDALFVPMAACARAGNAAGTLAIAWTEPLPGATGPNANVRRFQLREISAQTGRELFSGPQRAEQLVNQAYLRVLAASLLLVMVAVILFVLRADPRAIPVVPEGFVLADPVRRVCAAIIDYIPAALIAALVSGQPAFSLLKPTTVIGPGLQVTPLLIALALAAVHCTFGEWLFGCSLGKMALGLRVSRIPGLPAPAENPENGPETRQFPPRPPFANPALWQAAARNIVRWMVPIFGLFAGLDPARRHPGDVLARTIVVMPEEDEPAESDSAQDS